MQVDKTVRVWDVDTQKPLNSIAVSTDYVAFCFSADGRTLALEADKGVGLYRSATGELLRKITSPSVPRMGRPAVFSPDGKTLVTIQGTMVRLWDVGTSRMVRPIGGHHDTITCLSFAPDGKTLVSGSEDGTARLWEAMTGREILCFEKHEGPLAAVAYSPGSARIPAPTRPPHFLTVSDGAQVCGKGAFCERRPLVPPWSNIHVYRLRRPDPHLSASSGAARYRRSGARRGAGAF